MPPGSGLETSATRLTPAESRGFAPPPRGEFAFSRLANYYVLAAVSSVDCRVCLSGNYTNTKTATGLPPYSPDIEIGEVTAR